MAIECPQCGSRMCPVVNTNPNHTFRGKPIQVRMRKCGHCSKVFYSREQVIEGTTKKPFREPEPVTPETPEVDLEDVDLEAQTAPDPVPTPPAKPPKGSLGSVVKPSKPPKGPQNPYVAPK